MEGRRFHRWTVIEFAPERSVKYDHWRCRCDCGTDRIVSGAGLRIGKTKSCGCLRSDRMAELNRVNPPPLIDMTGQVYGRYTVLRVAEGRNERAQICWHCRCECGTERVVPGIELRTGNTRSCGCLKMDQLVERSTIHGKANTREHNIWCGMLNRCENPGNSAFKNYGGRGIKVCERWHEFAHFYEDIGEIPVGLSLDRIDVDGNYCPENVRLATAKEQANNKRRHKR